MPQPHESPAKKLVDNLLEKKASLSHSGCVRVDPKQLGSILRKLADKRNHLHPNQLGRKVEKMEKKAVDIGNWQAPLAGAAVGAVGGALGDTKNRARGALMGAGVGGLAGGIFNHLNSNQGVTPQPAAPQQPPQPPPVTMSDLGKAYGNAFKTNPIQTTGNTVMGLDVGRMGLNTLIGGLRASRLPGLSKMPYIPGSQYMAKGMPWIQEAANFSTDPQQGLNNSVHRSTVLLSDFSTQRGGLNFHNDGNLLSNPYLWAAASRNPWFAAANTISDLGQGARQAFREGGYGGMVNRALGEKATEIMNPLKPSTWQVGSSKEPITMARALYDHTIKNPNAFLRDPNDLPASTPGIMKGLDADRFQGYLQGSANKMTDSLRHANPGMKSFQYQSDPSGRNWMMDNVSGRKFLPNAVDFKRDLATMPPETRAQILQRLQTELPDLFQQIGT